MAQAFNLTAQIQVQANQSNINQTVNRIKKQLQPIGNVNLKVNTNAQALAKASKNVQGLSKGLQQSQKNAAGLNRTLAESARRFSVITVATGTLLSFVNAFKKSVRAAVEFEAELIKISQVTGRTTGQLKGLTDEVSKLSTSLGVSSADLLNTSRILLQTGLSADKATKALEILAKTSLAATFDDIQSTTEGAIAILNQFGRQAAATGNDIKFLEQSLDAINAVSKNFAVESGDLVSAIRRVGGVFSNAGGSVEELVALFTSVRQTTRESAETIATGLRTIFTRIQRAETVDQLRELGIQLQDAQGNFVGAFEAVKRLSEGLSGLDPRSFRFSQIVEELGGFRQIGKVIPLINQFTVAQNALNVAQNASGSVSKDAQTAQKGLGIEIAKTREQFNELIRSFTSSETFRSTTVFLLKLAQSFIKVAEAVEPLLPLLGTLFALKVGQGLAGGLGLLRGFAGGSSGIRASRFNSGGMVPGSGNRDTVPAMLTPGEFVIRKKSVEKLGANNLAQMNAKGYATGGIVDFPSARPYVKTSGTTYRKEQNKKFDVGRNRFNQKDKIQFDRTQSKNINVDKLNKNRNDVKNYFKQTDPRLRGFAFEQIAKKELNLNIAGGSSRIDASGPGGQIYEIKSEKKALSNTRLGEKLIGAAINPLSTIDQNVQKRLAKRPLTSAAETIPLGRVGVIQDITKGLGKTTNKKAKKALGGLIQRFAGGGSVLKTTQVGAAILDPNVPAKAAEKIGGVGVKDVQASAALRGSRFTSRVGEFIKAQTGTTSRQYTLKRQGLDKDTSNKFSTGILDGVLSGVNTASNKLGNDLGLGNIPVAKESEANLKRFFGKEGSVVGQLFEAAVNNVTNLGKFSESQIQAPFDFPGGITGALKDNYKTLPNTFVDAKKSYGVSTKANFKGKIANQIGREFIASPFNAAKKKASGGPAGSDTVPALLTPGEFVFNKKAADSIGRANLDRMNKQGVARFAKGGSVGFKTFASGGPTGAGLGLNNTNVGTLNAVLKALNSIGVSAGKTAESTARYNQSLNLAAQALLNGASSARAFDVAFKNLKQSSDQAKQSVEATAKAQAAARANPTAGNTVAGDTRLKSAQGLGGGSPTKSFGQAAAGEKKGTGVREALAAQQKKEIAAIAREIRATDQNVKAKDALIRAENVVRNEYGVLGKELIKSSKESKKTQKEQSNFAKAIQTTAAAIKKQGLVGAIASGAKAAPGAAGQIAGGAGQTFAKAGAATSSLQTFAFAGAALGGVATSALGLKGAQEEAAQQTIAMATTFLFLGSTVLDLLGNLSAFGTSSKAAAAANAQAAASEGVETQANLVNAGSEAAETQANVANTASEVAETNANLASAGSGLAGALIGVTAIAGGLFLAFQFLISEAEATAEAEAKKTKATLDSIRSGKGGSADKLRASVGREIEARDTANTRRGQRNLAVGGALAGAAATAAFGAAVGSAVPVVGTLIGAVVGAGVGLAIYAATSEDAAAKQESLNNALDSTINTLVAVNQANAEFQQKIQDINNLPLDAADKVNALLSAQASKGDGGLTTLEQNSQGVASALATLQSQLSATGDLTVNDLANLDEEGLKKLGEDEGLDPRVIKQIELAGATLNDSFKGLAAQTKQTRDTLGQAAQLEITGEVPFQELIQGSGAFATALRQAEAAARAEAQAKANRLKAEAAALQDQDPTGNADRVNELNKQAADEINRVNQTLAQQRAAYAKQNAALAENRARLQEEAKARLDQINLLKQQNAQLAAINNLTRGFENAKAATDDFVANLNGQVSQIEIRDTDLGADLPIGQLESNLTQFLTTIQSLPPQFQAAGQEAAFALRDSRKFIEGATGALVAQPEITQGLTADQIIEGVLGLDDDFLRKQLGGSEAALQQFKKQLQEFAASGGVITPEEAKQLFAPVREANEGYANQIKSLTDASRAQANALRAQTAKEIAIRDKNRESIENYNSVVSKNAEALASARGQSTAGVRRRLERENRQRLLDAGAGARGGIKLEAGNVKQLKLVRQQAKAAQEVILKQKALARQNGASAKTIAQLEKRQSQLAETVKDADAALQEFASSTAVIDELNEALEKEKQIREQAFAVLKEFVAGGKDVRKTLQSGAAGIFSALRTGTTQNQTEEQRADTFALLDKLKDVQIGTTGLTGQQVSNEIVFRDAVRLGFPPDIAKQLATQTTTEEQILQELQKQTAIAEDLAPVKFNKGGSVPGAGNTDSVPAMLTPGEFVLNKAAASRIGASNLNAMNSGVLYRQRGGDIPESLSLNTPKLNSQYDTILSDLIIRNAATLLNLEGDGQGQVEGLGRGTIIKADIGLTRKTTEDAYQRVLKGGYFTNDTSLLRDLFDTALEQLNQLNGSSGQEVKFSDFINNTSNFAGFPESETDYYNEIFLRNQTQLALKKAGEIQAEILEARLKVPPPEVKEEPKTKTAKSAPSYTWRAYGYVNPENPDEGINQAGRVYSADGIYLGVQKNGGKDKVALQFTGTRKIQDELEGGRGSKLIPIELLTSDSKRLGSALFKKYGRDATDDYDRLGLVYRANGGSIFQPRGTDTVPAMLTPGEFVIKKSSVDKIGAGNLAALNNGDAAVVRSQGGPIYRSGGGQVNYLARGGQGQGGGGINFGQAQTLQGGVNALSGDAAKSIYRQLLISFGQARVAKLIRKLIPGKAGVAAVKDLNQLIKTGQFDPSRFLGADLRALTQLLDQMNQLNPTIFTTLDASSATVGDAATVNGLQRWLDALTAANNNLRASGNPASKAIFAAITTNTPLEAVLSGYNNTLFPRITALKTQLENEIQRLGGGLGPNSTIRDIKAAGGAANTAVVAGGGPGGAPPGFVPPGGGGGGGGGGAGATLRAAGLYLAKGGLVYKQSGGRISYFNTGGNNVADTIPAMLTPGEFVMSPEAVQKYGVGYMKSLNRGTVPGFRRGGLIGSGNVRYRQNGSTGPESGGGGSLSIDASGLQGVLTEFSANFQTQLDNMVTTFSNVGNSINNLASALSQGMTITHNFSGDMSLAFSIQNQDQLKNAVADAIQPKIEEIISNEINRRLDEFQAGG